MLLKMDYIVILNKTYGGGYWASAWNWLMDNCNQDNWDWEIRTDQTCRFKFKYEEDMILFKVVWL